METEISNNEMLHQSCQNKPRKKGGNGKLYWTADEEQILRTNQMLPNKELCKLLPNRTIDAITTKKTFLGVKNGLADALVLTNQQKEYIEANLSHKTIGAIAKELGLHWKQVKAYVKALKNEHYERDTRVKKIFEFFNENPTKERKEELRKIIYAKYQKPQQ